MNETCQHSPSSEEEASHESLQLDHLLSLELLALANHEASKDFLDENG